MCSNFSPKDYVGNTIYNGFLHNNDAQLKTQYRWMYERVLTELAINRFKWEGLPDSVDVRFLEMTLHFRGLAIFYYEKDFDRFLVGRGSGSGALNMMDNPTEFIVERPPNSALTLSGKECVPIWANYMRTPDSAITGIYSQRIAESAMTVDINMINERHPFIISVPEDKRLTMINVLKDLLKGEVAVFGTEQLMPNELKDHLNVFNAGLHPNTTINSMTVATRLWNEAMNLLGIQASNTDKKERMIVDEIRSNDGQVGASRAVALNARREACQRIKQLYGIEVEVSWNDELGGAFNLTDNEGSGGNGDVHSNA